MTEEEIRRVLKIGRLISFTHGVIGKDKENFTWVLPKDKYYRIISFRILEGETYSNSVKIEAYLTVKSNVRKCIFSSSVIKEISKFPPVPEFYKESLATELSSISV